LSAREERALALALAVALLFVGVRVAILLARDPFFDELFTAWMARRPFGAILSALRLDSGPPLYYFLARSPSVAAERWLSIAFASIPMVVLLRQKRTTAALLLAIHPAAAVFAATARPYALCGALLAIGILLLERARVGAAASLFVAAAYTHFAAAFSLPTLLFGRAPLRRRALAFGVACLAFVPGLMLAMSQPREATAWMTTSDVEGVLRAISFVGESQLPFAAVIGAFLLTIVATGRSWRIERSRRLDASSISDDAPSSAGVDDANTSLSSALDEVTDRTLASLGHPPWRFAPFVLLPLVLAVAVSFVRPAFYPIRFASLLAFPLALWIADSLPLWRSLVRTMLVAALAAVGLGSIVFAVMTEMQRPLDDYRAAAMVLRQNASQRDTILASGYLYLESVHQLGDARVGAFPPEQGMHPGWRATAPIAAALPRVPFLWILERGAPEFKAARGRQVDVLYRNERAQIVRVR
jgi:hypothetical protein